MISVQEGARHELKFVAIETCERDVRYWLRNHSAGFFRPYPTRQVNNVYFDRPDYDSYAVSTEGVSARVKVRYRWYGEDSAPRPGQLEVKLRRNRLGWKESYPVPDLPTGLRRWTEIRRAILERLPAEGRWWLLEHDRPIVINHYEREYWVSRDGGIRATIDRRPVVYDQRLRATVNVSARAEMPRPVVLEIKCAAGSTADASRAVADLPLPLARHSKYCAAVETLHGA